MTGANAWGTGAPTTASGRPRLFEEGDWGARKLRCARSRASRRAQAVETGGIIRPLGIAEIGRAAGEGVGSHWRPNGVSQVRAGFHHDDQVASAGDVEPKPVRPQAKAGTAGLHLRVPQD